MSSSSPTGPRRAPTNRCESQFWVSAAWASTTLACFSSLKGVDLVGVVDTDAAPSEVAARFGCAAFADVVPDRRRRRRRHRRGAEQPACRRRGTPARARHRLLVEKPLASTETGAVQLVDAAARSGTPLLVGHIERFNPAVEQLDRILGGRSRRPGRRRSAHERGRARESPTSTSSTDLMVHDIDIVLRTGRRPCGRRRRAGASCAAIHPVTTS